MRKRLRKKKRLGEFREYCVTLHAILRGDLVGETHDRFLDDFIETAIESRGLQYGGACGPGMMDGVVSRCRGSVTAADGEHLSSWLEQNPFVESFMISEPWDGWHGTNPFDALRLPSKQG